MTTSEGRSALRGDRAHYAQLLDHAGRTTVGLRAAPGATATRSWGSGVLIAPGWVLTCAHVLAASDGRRRDTGPDGVFGVVFGGRVVPARLAYDLSRPAPEAGPAAARADLALVRLLDPETDHPCAWLSDQCGHAPGGRVHLPRARAGRLGRGRGRERGRARRRARGCGRRRAGRRGRWCRRGRGRGPVPGTRHA